MEQKKIVVVGGGVAGSAIAFELSQRGYEVVLLFRRPEEGSSFTNQKWNHSGLLYPGMDIAKKACDAFIRPSVLRDFVYKTQSRTRFLALHKRTLEEREQMWKTWGVTTWGLDWRFLSPPEYSSIGSLGETRAVGGFETPDCILDFPALIEHLHQEAKRNGGTVMPRADVRAITTKDERVSGIIYGTDQGTEALACSLCVIAAGAGTNTILENSGIRKPDLILRKCAVFEYDGELVPGITTCLDIRRHDLTLQDVTLVPFRGKTLAAGTGFTRITSGDDQEPDMREVERLFYQLVQCFPHLGNVSPKIKMCIKTERSPGGKPNVEPQVYSSEFHGVSGLVVAIPGKASFMFDLAEVVASVVDSANT